MMGALLRYQMEVYALSMQSRPLIARLFRRMKGAERWRLRNSLDVERLPGGGA
jgi:hypothetical protein